MSRNRGKVSCIIPAYNEAIRIGRVLQAVEGHPLIGQLIVIDDGSTDATPQVISRYKTVRCIHLAKNHGKSYAVMKGLMAATYDTILLLDADLEGLDETTIEKLVKPVLLGDADVSISYRENVPIHARYAGFEFLSGDRVFRKDLLGDYRTLKNLPAYGLEVFMNRRIIERRLRVHIASLKIRNTKKSKKIGTFRGILGEWKMGFALMRTVGPLHHLLDPLRMRKLIVSRN